MIRFFSLFSWTDYFFAYLYWLDLGGLSEGIVGLILSWILDFQKINCEMSEIELGSLQKLRRRSGREFFSRKTPPSRVFCNLPYNILLIPRHSFEKNSPKPHLSNSKNDSRHLIITQCHFIDSARQPLNGRLTFNLFSV